MRLLGIYFILLFKVILFLYYFNLFTRFKIILFIDNNYNNLIKFILSFQSSSENELTFNITKLKIK